MVLNLINMQFTYYNDLIYYWLLSGPIISNKNNNISQGHVNTLTLKAPLTTVAGDVFTFIYIYIYIYIFF